MQNHTQHEQKRGAAVHRTERPWLVQFTEIMTLHDAIEANEVAAA